MGLLFQLNFTFVSHNVGDGAIKACAELCGIIFVFSIKWLGFIGVEVLGTSLFHIQGCSSRARDRMYVFFCSATR